MVNFWAILVSAIIYNALGAFWYSEKGFGNVWLKLRGLKKEDVKMDPKIFGLTFLSSILIYLFLGIIIDFLSMLTIGGYLLIGLLVWGASFLTQFIQALYDDQNLKNLLLYQLYQLIGILVASLILGIWQ